MSDEITKDRSPRSPLVTLEEALEVTRKLYSQARTTAVKAESAVRALGYSGMTGSSMTVLATLGQYGLVDRTTGHVGVSSLAVRILHPSSDEQKETAIREAAQLPKVFQEHLKGFEHCSVEIIANHLIQAGFAPERARKVAQIYLENRKFARLDAPTAEPEITHRLVPSRTEEPILQASVNSTAYVPPQSLAVDVLAQYTIPLGENQATLVFTGSALTAEDFDALADFVEFAKKQFLRKAKSQQMPT